MIEELTDAALDDEIGRALAVKPSPAFVATIRQRVAREHMSGAWTWSRIGSIAAVGAGFVTGIAIAVALGLRMTTSPPSPPVATQPIQAGTQRILDAETPAVAVREIIANAAAPRRVRSAPGGEPAIIIDPGEARAMHAFLNALIHGRLDVAGLINGSMPPVMDRTPAADIQIEPIDLPPLSDAARPTDKGEPQ